MGIIYKNIIRPALFKQDAERAHEYAVLSLKVLSQMRPLTRLMSWYNKTHATPVELFGLKFPNLVGLGAGFDKNAECWRAAEALGFGHVEVGTVTYHGQSGNPKPRLFRFPEEQAIINRMGFNNDGAQAIAERLSSAPPRGQRSVPVGINIGKSKITALEDAADDYVGSFNLLADYADYFTINISSPNTAGLRTLQNENHLPSLLSALKKANHTRAKKLGTLPTPILVKISPDLTFPEIDIILRIVQDLEFSGIIATNTALARPGGMKGVDCAGGLSGSPLHPIATQAINYIYKATEGKLPIIGVGGIMDEYTAGKTLDAGASLIQLYTGLIYEGPFLGRRLAKSLAWQHRNWV